MFIVGYAAARKGHFPRNMADLLVLPETFGVPESARMDLSIRSLEEVVTVAQRVQSFCASRGIDQRRAYLAGLSMEEMTGNIVEHGFTKDHKKHSVDIRVVHKEEKIILRLRDDCIAFDPEKRLEIADPGDPTRNIGLRMVFAMASQVKYQSILGMNVLAIRI
jgi:anti-sigma regulatory factor (Ser/Thr protein kinase)